MPVRSLLFFLLVGLPVTVTADESKILDPKDFSHEEWKTLFSIGMAQVQGTRTECDRLTANAHDPGLTAEPVDFDDLDAPAAVRACEADLAKDPTNGRLMNNLARAHNKAEDYVNSHRWTARAVEAGYRYANHVMSLHYRYGEGVEKSRAEEVRWLEKARERGIPVSSLVLAQYAMEDYRRRDYDAARVRQLLRESGQGRSSSWAWGDYYWYEAIRDYHWTGIFDSYRNDQLPDPRDVSNRFGPARLSEFRNLLRSSRAHYADAQLTGDNQLRKKRIAAIDRVLERLRNTHALR